MSKSIIEVTQLSKKYRYGQSLQRYYTLRDTLSGIVKSPKNLLSKTSKKSSEREFWALKDISFKVNEGEVLGIIGPNGAGKSTLLKVLSQITPPTSGKAILRGRVGSLLEVGTGFHQELTGRENIYLNGAVLGMSRREINKKFDEIVDFSGVEKFLDTPVKRYSSGMLVRLGFAVAAHLDPEILLIDEVLAVGDAEFQKKCLSKMGEVARSGRTILFVSHNLESIKNLCTQTLLLKHGKSVAFGKTSTVINKYIKIGAEKEEFLRRDSVKKDILIKKVSVLNREGGKQSSFDTDEQIRVQTELFIKKSIKDSVLGIVISNIFGVKVFTVQKEIKLMHNRTLKKIKYDLLIPTEFLNKNTYKISVYVLVPNVKIIDSIEDCLNFEVIGTAKDFRIYQKPEEVGLVLCSNCEWNVSHE